jgi:hypothetical protein
MAAWLRRHPTFSYAAETGNQKGDMTIFFGPGLVAALALLLALIHPSTCKVNSPKFAGRGFSELPRRPSENCYSRGIRFPQGGPTRRGSKALLSLQEGEQQMISTVASKDMRVGERSS